MTHRVLLSTVALTIGVLVLLPAQTPIAGQKPAQGVKAQPAGKTWEKLFGFADGESAGQGGSFRDWSRQLQPGHRDRGSQGAGSHSG
jgi:hypothetical protein